MSNKKLQDHKRFNKLGMFTNKASEVKPTEYKLIDLPECPPNELLDLFINIDFRKLDELNSEVKIDSNLCKNGTSLQQEFPLVFGCNPAEFSTNLTALCQPNMPNSRQLITASCSADPAILGNFITRATNTIEKGLSGQYSESVIAKFHDWQTNLPISSSSNSYNFTSCSEKGDGKPGGNYNAWLGYAATAIGSSAATCLACCICIILYQCLKTFLMKKNNSEETLPFARSDYRDSESHQNINAGERQAFADSEFTHDNASQNFNMG